MKTGRCVCVCVGVCEYIDVCEIFPHVWMKV